MGLLLRLRIATAQKSLGGPHKEIIFLRFFYFVFDELMVLHWLKLFLHPQPNCDMGGVLSDALVLLKLADVLHFVRFHICRESKERKGAMESHQVSNGPLIFMKFVSAYEALTLIVGSVYGRLNLSLSRFTYLSGPNVDQAL